MVEPFSGLYTSIIPYLNRYVYIWWQVINKTDLAEAVGANLKVMEQDALKMRDGGPFVFAQVGQQMLTLNFP